ncbi:MAG: hypothetical protein M1823_003968 [Watsoniomyces obsoletus]|nr:MAG: hypothetical protein M1823_003968 [Watsoniomyces obsoletus]
MTSLEQPSSPSLIENASVEEALAYYKAQYEQLEHELSEFQASSRELETELEKDIEASEKRERKLQEKVEGLGYEVEEWKTKYKQSKAEASAVQSTLQKEITSLRETHRTTQLKLRDIEVSNDDIERQARNTFSSLEDLESKYNVALERAVMLEVEVHVGDREREALRIETQRLRDELSDLRIEAEITQEKVRRLEAAANARPRVPRPLPTETPVGPQLAKSEVSPASTASSPTRTTPPPLKSTSTSVSDTPTPPSPPASEASTNLPLASNKPRPALKSRTASSDLHTTPMGPPGVSRLQRPSFGRGSMAAPARPPPSSTPRTSLLSRPEKPHPGLPSSGSLRQIRGLIGQVQRLERRVHTVRSRLPGPGPSSRGSSPHGTAGSSSGNVPASVTVRSHKKRSGGSNILAGSGVDDSDGETTPLPSRRVSRISSGIPTASATTPRTTDSRPSSRTSAYAATPSMLARPGSRASVTGTRTPLGHYASATITEGRRPRSSMAVHYSAIPGHGPSYGHGHSASVSGIEEVPAGFGTPTPRRNTVIQQEAGAMVSNIPTPTSSIKRPSAGGDGVGVSRLAQPSFGTSSVAGPRPDRDRTMGPPERRRPQSGIGFTH